MSKIDDAENPFLLLHKYRNLIPPEAHQRIDRAIYRIKTNRDTSQMRVIYDELEKVIKLQTNLLHFQNYVEDTTANENASSFQQLLEQEPSILKESSYLQPLSDPPEMHIEAREDLLRILRTVLAESLRSASNRTVFLFGPQALGRRSAQEASSKNSAHTMRRRTNPST